MGVLGAMFPAFFESDFESECDSESECESCSGDMKVSFPGGDSLLVSDGGVRHFLGL